MKAVDIIPWSRVVCCSKLFAGHSGTHETFDRRHAHVGCSRSGPAPCCYHGHDGYHAPEQDLAGVCSAWPTYISIVEIFREFPGESCPLCPTSSGWHDHIQVSVHPCLTNMYTELSGWRASMKRRAT